MGNLAYWFISRFIASNNFRLAVLWVVILIHLLFNVFVFGMVETKQFSNFSDTRQELYNHSFQKKFATNQELYPVNYYLHGLRTTSWEIWFVLLAAGIIYFPIALREEVARAWAIARQRTSAFEDMPNPTPPAPATTRQGNINQASRGDNTLKQFFVFIREFVSALAAELLVEGARR